ncbi:MAG: hypothetical protein CVV02_11630 [Firmicutes bacterium HGW-Firmicutes-7]|nr:MAG: hypothetical protein CVV02_11630 [Firmicutes bacterium HGW-Firmicutes-7]
MPENNKQNQVNNNERYYQQKFLEHAAFSEHYARLKMANAANSIDYYRYAELEYFNKSRALHYKGLFKATSTLDNLY